MKKSRPRKEEISLPLVRIEKVADQVKVTSVLVGTSTTLDSSKLQNWAIAQLRKDLLFQKAVS